MARLNLIAAILVVICPSLLLAESTAVGELGNPKNWVISGNETFSSETISNSLAADLALLRASHPAAGRDEFARVVQHRLAEGYRHCGFGDANVKVTFHDTLPRLLINVVEGNRYVAGRIVVVGVANAEEEELRQLLTTKSETPLADKGERSTQRVGKEVAPLWQPGKYVKLDVQARRQISQRVRRFLSDAGYRAAGTRVAVAKMPRDRRAGLTITVDDLGPLATIQEIEVTGNTVNSTADFTSYLKIKLGTVLTQREQTRIKKLLQDSVRFSGHRIGARPHPDGVTLLLDVNESPHSPPLSRELTEDELTWAGLPKLIQQMLQSKQDILMRGKTGDFRFQAVFSAAGELYIAVAPPGDAFVASHAITFDNDRTTIYAFGANRKLSWKTESVLRGNAHLSRGDEERPYRFNFGGSLSRRNANTRGPNVQIDLDVSPDLFLSMAPKHRPRFFDLGNDDIAMRSADMELILNPGTESFAYRVFPNAKESFELVLQKGAYNHALAGLSDQTASCVECLDSKRPISSIAKFFCETGILRGTIGQRLPEFDPYLRPEFLASIAMLIDRGLLSSLDQKKTKSSKKPHGDKFELPTAAADDLPWFGEYSVLAILLMDDVFPHGSWPWTIAREECFRAIGVHDPSAPELNRITAENRGGPLMLATLAWVTRRTPNLSRQLAEVATRRISPEYFRRDYRELFDADLYGGKLLGKIVTIIDQFDEAEMAAFCQGLGVDQQLVTILQSLRGNKLPPNVWLDAIWSGYLSDMVQASLKRVVESKSPLRRLPPTTAAAP